MQLDDENDYINDLDDDVFKLYLDAGGSLAAVQEETSLGSQGIEYNTNTVQKMGKSAERYLYD